MSDTDIVERLLNTDRGYDLIGKDCADAADEIVGLRSACSNYRARLATAENEIERLRAGRAADPEAVEAARRIDVIAKTNMPNWRAQLHEEDIELVVGAYLSSASSRAAVAEECAKVADSYGDYAHARDIAKRIRALTKEQP